MKNSVKEDWKRRIHATIAILLAMVVLAALWSYGRSFAKALQINGKDVGRILVNRADSSFEFTDRGSINEFMSYVNHFRYNFYFDRSHLSGCMPDYYVKLFNHSGRELVQLIFVDEGVLVYNVDVYLCDTPYFAPLRQQLGL